MNEKPKMYWDGGNGRYTKEETDCPVYKGTMEGIYFETWSSAMNRNELLDVAFTQADKDNYMEWKIREAQFKRYNFTPMGAIKLILPPKFYKEMYKRFIE